MPYLGEPYDQDYYEGGSLIRKEGYHDYSRPALEQYIRNIADDIETETGLVSGKDVLDVGCAYGYLTDELALRGANVIGIDLSAWAISQANSMFPTRTFQQDDFLASGFSNNQFDLLVSCGALGCMSTDPEMQSFVNEVNRVTRPTGIYYFLMDYDSSGASIYQNKTTAEWLAAMEAGLPGPYTFDVEEVGHLPIFYATRVVVT